MSSEGSNMEDKGNIQISPFNSIMVSSSLDDQEEKDSTSQPSVLSQQFSSWKSLLKYLVIFIDNLMIWHVYLMNMDSHSSFRPNALHIQGGNCTRNDWDHYLISDFLILEHIK